MSAPMDVWQRLSQHIDFTPSCWLWTGARDRRGYGYTTVRSRQTVAHRATYRLHRGEIPEGLELDHLCRVKSCVNPWHLEAVTHLVNVRRSSAGENNRARTHCPQGHPYAGENLINRSSGNQQHRTCRTCQTASSAKRWRRHQARYPESWTCKGCGKTLGSAHWLGRHLRATGHGRYEDHLLPEPEPVALTLGLDVAA